MGTKLKWEKPMVLVGTYVSVKDYAKRSGLSEATVKRRCVSGDLPAERVGDRSWLIKVED